MRLRTHISWKGICGSTLEKSHTFVKSVTPDSLRVIHSKRIVSSIPETSLSSDANCVQRLVVGKLIFEFMFRSCTQAKGPWHVADVTSPSLTGTLSRSIWNRMKEKSASNAIYATMLRSRLDTWSHTCWSTLTRNLSSVMNVTSPLDRNNSSSAIRICITTLNMFLRRPRKRHTSVPIVLNPLGTKEISCDIWLFMIRILIRILTLLWG